MASPIHHQARNDTVWDFAGVILLATDDIRRLRMSSRVRIELHDRRDGLLTATGVEEDAANGRELATELSHVVRLAIDWERPR
jgi:hypothetical protein